MQTPAGATLSADGTEAVITDFFTAAFNVSTLPRYAHTVLALLVMGAFIAIAVAAWYMLKGRHASAARKILKTGSIVGVVAVIALLGSAHSSAVEVWEEQPTKLAMMEGQYETGVPELSLFGWVDQTTQEAITLSSPGGTSFLATGTWDTEYPGLNDLAQTDRFSQIDITDMPVNFVYQTYHVMVAMFGLIAICIILALVFSRKKSKHRIENMRWLQRLLVISPLFPLIAIQAGWFTAEVGRQPYVVYPALSSPDGVSLLTSEGASASVTVVELAITLVLFVAVYVLLFVGWARVCGRFIKRGPVDADKTTAAKSSPQADEASDDEIITFAEIDIEENGEGKAVREGGAL
jgi:cytochrome d ubiquinol oxidase subunit I